jgi:excisionase family DNA binding protein
MAVHVETRVKAGEGCLLDVPAAAERLGVTQRWVRRAVAERRISFVKIGRNVRFEPEALTRYIELQRNLARDDAAQVLEH